MKQFISFVRKEFYHIFRDLRTMLILLGMPVVQIILFGFAITTEVKNVKVAVLDFSKDVSTRQIIDKLDASDYFNVNKILYDNNEIEETLRKSSSDLIIVFEAGFDNNLRHTGKARVQLIADATDPNNATILTSYASNIIADYQQSRIMQQQSPIQIIPQIKLLYNPGMQSAYNFVPGVMGLILMLICAMMTSISIVREKETGTMEVLLVSPVRPLWMIIAKMVPYFVLSCVNLVTILLLSVYVLHVPVGQSFFVGFALMDLHRSISAVGIIGFHYRPYPSGSHAVFGNGTDDAYRSTFRHDIPHREYASSFTADFKCHPCQMVYCRNQENHD